MPQVKPPHWFLWVCLLLSLLLAACQTPNATLTPSPAAPSPTKDAKPFLTLTATSIPTATLASSPTLPTPYTTEDAQPSPLPSETPGRRVILMAVGDIMLGRTIGEMIEANSSQAPFLDVADTLRSADITVGNLECPISDRGEPEPKTYTFRAPVTAGESLAFAGFDLVNLANNHSLDYGPHALSDTLEILAANEIQTVGAGMDAAQAYAPAFIEVDGLRIAFLGFVDVHPTDYDYRAWEAGPNQPGVAWAHEDRVREGVIAAKAEADIVIVLVHNGYELVERIGSQQQLIAQAAIESGASLVIGSHPHVLQRIERYQEGLIAYSLGNFVFDNYLFPPNYSGILVVELTSQGVKSYHMIDVIVQLNGVPQIMPYNRDN
ncbi:MAG: CapA family protein [Brevefilum sp.]